MANSQYEYVKKFEQHTPLLPSTFIVVRIDGRGFHRLSAKYGFQKPNDRCALDLMNTTALNVMKELPDIAMAYGVSDEYSFVFDRACTLFDRRESKILTTVVSTFTSYFVHLWPTCFPRCPLSSPMPSFDGRVILYPSHKIVRDYMSWRQADCHINNLYNTTFWTLVQKGGIGNTAAEGLLKGTQKSEKNEILFNLGINYNNEPEIYRKGSILYRDYADQDHPVDSLTPTEDDPDKMMSQSQKEKEGKRRRKAKITLQHTDIIQDDFWEKRPWLVPSSS